MDDFFTSQVADTDEAVARELARLIEHASSRVTVPVQVLDGTELVVPTTAGPYRLTITRAGSALPRVA
jgi:hypothetical protein